MLVVFDVFFFLFEWNFNSEAMFYNIVCRFNSIIYEFFNDLPCLHFLNYFPNFIYYLLICGLYIMKSRYTNFKKRRKLRWTLCTYKIFSHERVKVFVVLYRVYVKSLFIWTSGKRPQLLTRIVSCKLKRCVVTLLYEVSMWRKTTVHSSSVIQYGGVRLLT